MWFSSTAWLLPLALAGSVQALPKGAKIGTTASHVRKGGVTYNVFEHAATGARLEYVNNSGICETTKGVNQYSGYLSVGENQNMFFWYGSSLSMSQLWKHLTGWSGSSRVATTRNRRRSLPGSTAAPAALP